MRTIIAGSRHFDDTPAIVAAIESCPWLDKISFVWSGGARGVDTVGEWWADSRNIPWQRDKPTKKEWEMYGKQAGPIRNGRMAKKADALILVWDGKSKGSKDMKEKAEQCGLEIWEVRL